MRLLTLTLAVVLCVSAAPPDTKRLDARSLFYDPTSGAASSTPPVSPGHTPAPARPVVNVRNTGIMYYVELIKPSGEKVRVTTSRTFHTGDKIQLHVQTNVDGRLVIVQKQKDGSSQVIFPDKRVNGGSNTLHARADTIVPSEDSWFKFDDNPGEEHILMLLTTEAAYEQVRQDVAAATTDAKKADELSRNIAQHRTDRGLVLQVDDKADKPATYVVSTNSTAPPTTAGIGTVVATEIVLNHQ